MLIRKSIRKKLSLLVTATLVLESPFAVAGSRAYETVPNTTASATTGSTAPAETSTLNAVNNYSPTVIDTTSINARLAAQQANKNGNTENQGKDAGSSQMMGMLAGLAGAAFSAGMAMKTCTTKPPQPSCPAWIIGALASAAVAAAMGAAKKKSNQTVTDVSSSLPVDSKVEAQTESRLVETNRQIEETASKVGIKANTKTASIRLPDGRTLNAADLGNKQALAAAGFSPAEIASFQDATQKALKEGQKVAAKGLDSNGGGAGEALAVGSGAGLKTTEATTPETAAGGARRDPAQTQGLSKDYNGSPIGVASENLFTLINRRYDHVANQNSLFIAQKKNTQQ